MLKDFFNHPHALIYSILLHVLFLGLLFVSFEWSSQHTPQPAKIEAVQAKVVDEKLVQQELRKLKAEDNRKKQSDLDRQKKIKQEERRIKELKKKSKEEKAEKKRLEKERKKAEKEKSKVEKEKRKVEQDKKRIEAERNKAEAEKKQAQEATRKAVDERKRIEAERKKREEAKRRANEAAQRKRELAAEQAALKAERDRRNNSEINKHITVIKQKVTRNWIQPAKAKKGLSCEILVRLVPPGGSVIDAQIVKSSGDAIFDRSVLNAVFKASPLPLPRDTALHSRFREIRFKFEPK